ncbi:MAG: FG-GAP-like repeat-containing protein [Pirellula sp.]
MIVERPQSAPALFLAARSMAARGNVKGAIQTLSKIDPNDRDAGPAATGQLAEWLAQSGDLLGAETKLLSLIQSFPTAVPALRLLVDIYHAQGRRWEAAKYLERLIRLGNFGTPDLMHSIDFRDPVDQETLRTAAERIAPDEPTSKLHALRVLAYADRWVDAVGPLRSLVESRPDWLEPWIWYGEALLETQQTDALSTWLQHRPNGWEQHPEFWYILGRTLQLQDQHDQAARCFAEALQRDRRHVASMQSLAESLMELQQPELALQVRERAGKLVRIKDLSLQIQRGHGKRQEFVDIANLYRELEDAVGAFGWDAALLASEKQPFPPELVATQQRLRTGAKVPNPWLDGLNVAAWPMPALDALPSPTEKPRASISSGGAIPIQFRDVANELGIDARYNNGAPEGRGWYTHEGLGGGVSALDYDRDGWPDLFFSQAGDHPNATPPKYLPKQLFRSLQSQRFVDVAGLARIADLGYGQGTGVVDLDQDGFQDLLIADIGEIKCYRNQGDGTFERWELPQAPAPAIWNSAIQGADINADGLPDIIQCAYIHGTDFLTRTCASSSDSKLLFCHPKRFEPGHTRILINAGDGRFNLLDAAILDALVDGYALGTIITNIDQRFGNDIYFANDVSANHLLLSQASRAGKADLDEVAMRAGVAVDSLGRPQASMGVACGDQNRDGLLDLIVTNFRFEVSTLYLQTSPGVFRDGTRGSRLGEATFEWLSFGCQLSDLDNDGWLDFITVNGHIDFLDPWQMPPQVLHNRQGQFQWLRTPSPGAYFDVDNVGRSLTMTDFNRDGRLDFAITHLDRRAALLRNDSPREDRHWLQLELIGTVSERDATGAIIHLRSGAEEWVVPVAVGDGYYGTNERIVHVGVGSAKQIDALEIAWPSGHSDSVRDVPVDRRVRCIESQGVTAVELLSPP